MASLLPLLLNTLHLRCVGYMQVSINSSRDTFSTKVQKYLKHKYKLTSSNCSVRIKNLCDSADLQLNHSFPVWKWITRVATIMIHGKLMPNPNQAKTESFMSSWRQFELQDAITQRQYFLKKTWCMVHLWKLQLRQRSTTKMVKSNIEDWWQSWTSASSYLENNASKLHDNSDWKSCQSKCITILVKFSGWIFQSVKAEKYIKKKKENTRFTIHFCCVCFHLAHNPQLLQEQEHHMAFSVRCCLLLVDVEKNIVLQQLQLADHLL